MARTQTFVSESDRAGKVWYAPRTEGRPELAGLRCVNNPRLDPVKTHIRCCRRAICDLHGWAVRRAMVAHMDAQLPTGLPCWSGIVHLNRRVGGAAVGQVDKRLRAAIAKHSRGATVFVFTHFKN